MKLSRGAAGFVLAVAALLPASAGAQPAPVPPGSLSIPIPADGQPQMPVRIKDRTIPVRIALGFDKALLLNLGPAQQAGLKPFPLLGKRQFKNSMIPGGQAMFRFNLFRVTPQGFERTLVPTVWVDKPIATDADGIMSVMVLDAERITFTQGPIAPGSTTFALPRKGSGSAMVNAKIGKETIRIGLELRSPESIMNRRAAEALQSAGLVRRTGKVGLWQPFPDVALPFERLSPRAGATLLGLPIRNAAVRITEEQAKRLDSQAKAGTSTAEDDEDAITVTASRDGDRGRSPWMLIGRDVLSKCSRIVLDRPGKQWLLTCNFAE